MEEQEKLSMVVAATHAALGSQAYKDLNHQQIVGEQSSNLVLARMREWEETWVLNSETLETPDQPIWSTLAAVTKEDDGEPGALRSQGTQVTSQEGGQHSAGVTHWTAR